MIVFASARVRPRRARPPAVAARSVAPVLRARALAASPGRWRPWEAGRPFRTSLGEQPSPPRDHPSAWHQAAPSRATNGRHPRSLLLSRPSRRVADVRRSAPGRAGNNVVPAGRKLRDERLRSEQDDLVPWRPVTFRALARPLDLGRQARRPSSGKVAPQARTSSSGNPRRPPFADAFAVTARKLPALCRGQRRTGPSRAPFVTTAPARVGARRSAS